MYKGECKYNINAILREGKTGTFRVMRAFMCVAVCIAEDFKTVLLKLRASIIT
jgi:hypothetical protein